MRIFWTTNGVVLGCARGLNTGASAKECRNKRLHLLNACVAEFKDVGGLTVTDVTEECYRHIIHNNTA